MRDNILVDAAVAIPTVCSKSGHNLFRAVVIALTRDKVTGLLTLKSIDANIHLTLGWAQSTAYQEVLVLGQPMNTTLLRSYEQGELTEVWHKLERDAADWLLRGEPVVWLNVDVARILFKNDETTRPLEWLGGVVDEICQELRCDSCNQSAQSDPWPLKMRPRHAIDLFWLARALRTSGGETQWWQRGVDAVIMQVAGMEERVSMGELVRIIDVSDGVARVMRDGGEELSVMVERLELLNPPKIVEVAS